MKKGKGKERKKTLEIREKKELTTTDTGNEFLFVSHER
jgi:hypothetical protein